MLDLTVAPLYAKIRTLMQVYYKCVRVLALCDLRVWMDWYRDVTFPLMVRERT